MASEKAGEQKEKRRKLKMLASHLIIFSVALLLSLPLLTEPPLQRTVKAAHSPRAATFRPPRSATRKVAGQWRRPLSSPQAAAYDQQPSASILCPLPFYCLSGRRLRRSSKLRPESSAAISSSFLKTRYCRGVITGMYAVLNSQTMGYTLIQGHEITLHSEQG